MFFLYRIVYSFNWGGLAAMVALSLQIVVGSLAGIAYALIVIRRFPPPWKKTKKNEIKSWNPFSIPQNRKGKLPTQQNRNTKNVFSHFLYFYSDGSLHSRENFTTFYARRENYKSKFRRVFRLCWKINLLFSSKMALTTSTLPTKHITQRRTRSSRHHGVKKMHPRYLINEHGSKGVLESLN